VDEVKKKEKGLGDEVKNKEKGNDGVSPFNQSGVKKSYFSVTSGIILSPTFHPSTFITGAPV
jgi:hypothetical protein